MTVLQETRPPFPEPEDRGTADLSPLGEVEYIADLVRPGRIVVWAGEEGSGKSYTVAGELAIRMAAAGGDLAGTWPVLSTCPILIVSEMHADDDYSREQQVLKSLGIPRSALRTCYYRLSTLTAAHGEPVLDVTAWRNWITEWLRLHDVRVLIVDTATSATRVDPWGSDIRDVFRNLRVMLDAFPELAIILTVHLKKPQGSGRRRISDVMGEWGRWSDVLVLQEPEGSSLSRVRLTVRKRVRVERRITATKTGGLLVDPQDSEDAAGPKVPPASVIATIAAAPGLTVASLGKKLEVSPSTAAAYARMAEQDGAIERRPTGPRGQLRLYPKGTAPSDLPSAFDNRVGRFPEGQLPLPSPTTFRPSDDSMESEGGRKEAALGSVPAPSVPVAELGSSVEDLAGPCPGGAA